MSGCSVREFLSNVLFLEFEIMYIPRVLMVPLEIMVLSIKLLELDEEVAKPALCPPVVEL